jgi:peptidylprolyl isomerase
MKRLCLFLAAALAAACTKAGEEPHAEPTAPPPPTKSRKGKTPPAGTVDEHGHPTTPKKPQGKQAKPATPPLDVANPPADAEKSASGLVFKSLVEGTGASPGPNDSVKVVYAGWKPDGTTFMNIEDASEPMPLFKTAPGFSEALQKMKVGGKAMFWVPPEIGAPGGRARGSKDTLAYAVELVDVVPAPATPPDVAKAPADAKQEASGVAWKKVKTADGARPDPWDVVEIKYTGWDESGKIVDSSEVQGKPVTIPLDALPAPFVEAVPALAVGERVRIWFPAQMLGRGPGSVPGNLTFEIELVSITDRVKPPDAPADVAKPPADAKKTEKGVFYKVLEAGGGSQQPTTEDEVTVHYTGWTPTGSASTARSPTASRASSGSPR